MIELCGSRTFDLCRRHSLLAECLLYSQGACPIGWDKGLVDPLQRDNTIIFLAKLLAVKRAENILERGWFIPVNGRGTTKFTGPLPVRSILPHPFTSID